MLKASSPPFFAIGKRNAIRPLRGLHVLSETETASTSTYGAVRSRTALHFLKEPPTHSNRGGRRTRKEDRRRIEPRALRALTYSRPSVAPKFLSPLAY